MPKPPPKPPKPPRVQRKVYLSGEIKLSLGGSNVRMA